jgi:hypothetical protein
MKRNYKVLISLFLIPVYLLAMINLFWPPQLVSESENRTLKQLPPFSFESLINGTYTLEFESYFSDQFPFRQFFINAHSKGVDLLQAPLTGDVDVISRPGEDIGIGESLENDPNDVVTQPTTTQTTTSETSLIETAPAVSETVSPETTSPTTTEPEVTVPNVQGDVENISSVIIVNGYAMELYYYNADRAARYIGLVNRLKDKVPEARVFDLVAPTSVEFNSPAKYHSNASSQKAAIADIYSKLSEDVITVDAYDKMVRRYGEYLHFRTDHHWTARGAYYAYTAYCESAGLEAVPMDKMEQGFVPGDFLGSLYKYTNSSKLTKNPDQVEYFLPIVSSEGVAYSDATMTSGYKVSAVRTETKSSNKYLVFIGGDHPLTHFKTTLTNGRSVLVLKESYGNAFVPYLTNHYENVYVIDPRSLKCDLPAFILEKNIQDIVVLNYSFSVTSSGWNNGFEKMIG